MLLFNQMYREGLLTGDSFTVDKSQLDQVAGPAHVTGVFGGELRGIRLPQGHDIGVADHQPVAAQGPAA